MKEISTFFLIFIGGGIGASLRYSVSFFIQTPITGFPMPTFIVNILGCFFIGLLSSFLNFGNESLKLFVLIGLIGGFTTFSAFGNETIQLMNKGFIQTALIYVFLSNICGLLSVYFGSKLSAIF